MREHVAPTVTAEKPSGEHAPERVAPRLPAQRQPVRAPRVASSPQLARDVAARGMGNRATINALADAGVRVTAPDEAIERQAGAVAAAVTQPAVMPVVAVEPEADTATPVRIARAVGVHGTAGAEATAGSRAAGVLPPRPGSPTRGSAVLVPGSHGPLAAVFVAALPALALARPGPVPAVSSVPLTKAAARAPPAPAGLPPVVAAGMTGGQPVEPTVRTRLEGVLGNDLGQMRVHTGPAAAEAAASVGARAFTLGRDVVIGASESPTDLALMAHEATHVVQQTSGAARQALAREEDDDWLPDVDVTDIVPDWMLDEVRSLVRGLPGYGLVCAAVGQDLLTGEPITLDLGATVEALLLAGPFGAGVSAVLAAMDLLGSIWTVITSTLAEHRITVGRITGDIEAAWDDLTIGNGVEGNVAVVRGYLNAFLADIRAAVGALVDQLIQAVREAIVPLVEPYLTEGPLAPVWNLATKVMHYNPLTGAGVDATTVEIIGDFLSLIGQDEVLAQMAERGTLQQTADWVDTQIAVFSSLIVRAATLFTDAWDAISPANLPDLLDTLPGLASRAVDLFGDVVAFGSTLIEQVLVFIRDSLLEWLSERAHGLRGFRLLTVILGRNPFTQAPVERNAENLIGGFVELVAGPETYAQLAESGVIAEAAGRIEGELARLNISWELITGTFLAIWEGMSLADFLDPPAAIERVISQFGEPLSRIISFAATVIQVVLELVLRLMNFPSDLLGSIIAGVQQALASIQADPVGFLNNLLAALKQGFSQFFDNILVHLVQGLADWLFRGLRGLGIEIPTELSGEAILKLALDVMGLSVEFLWECLGEVIGQERVAMIRGAIGRLGQAWAFISDVQARGMVAIWEYISSQLGNLWDTILTMAKDWLVTNLIEAAVAKVLSMLDPTGVMAVINSCIAFYRAVQSVIEYVTEILQIIKTYVDTIAAIAVGNIGPGATLLETGLANAIPVAIGFLASQVGLGDIPEKVVEIINGLRQAIKDAVVWLIRQAFRLGQAALDALTGAGSPEPATGAPGAEPEPGTPAPEGADAPGEWSPDRVKAAAAGQVVARVGADPSPQSLRALLQSVAGEFQPHGLRSIEVVPSTGELGAFSVRVAASPISDAGGFRVNKQMRLSELKLSHGTTATAHLNGTLLGTASAGTREVEEAGPVSGHAEQMLAAHVSGQLHSLSAAGTLDRRGDNELVIRITRSPCDNCTGRLMRLADQFREFVAEGASVRIRIETASIYQAGGSERRAQALFDLNTLHEHGIEVKAWDIMAHAEEVFGPDVDKEKLQERADEIEDRVQQTKALLEALALRVEPTSGGGPTMGLLRDEEHHGDEATIAALAAAGVSITTPDDAMELQAAAVSHGVTGPAPMATTVAASPARTRAPPVTGLPRQIDAALAGGAPVSDAIRPRLEASLGADLKEVRVHTGSAAAWAAAAVGARAFTLGRDVVLGAGESPTDVGLLAHEATHVAQQTGGGVLARDPAKPDDLITAAAYAHAHREAILAAYAQFQVAVRLPKPHPRLFWAPAARPSDVVVQQLREHLRADKGLAARNLYLLLPGVHLGRIIDDARAVPPHPPEAYTMANPKDPAATPPPLFGPPATLLDFTRATVPPGAIPHYGPRGTAAWRPAVGSAIAAALYPKVLESLYRLGGRFLAVAELSDRQRRQLAEAPVTTAYPMDDIVYAAMNQTGVLRWVAGNAAADNAEGVRALKGPKPMNFAWLGDSDRGLRHWIRVWEPVRATPDDVATMLVANGWVREYDLVGSLDAIAKRSSPPYFWVPVVAPQFRGATGPAVEDAFGLGASAVADDVARAQVPQPKAADPRQAAVAADHADQLVIQLAQLRTRMLPWGAAGARLDGALAFARRRLAEATADPRSAARWAPHLTAQGRAVSEIASQASMILDQLERTRGELARQSKRSVSPAEVVEGVGLQPLVGVLVAYGAAAGLSHLPNSLAPAVAEARRLQRDLPHAMAQLRVDAAIRAVQEEEETLGQLKKPGQFATAEAAKDAADVPGIAERSAALRALSARGAQVDPGELEQLEIDADVVATRARLGRLRLILEDIDRRAEAADIEEDEPPRSNNLAILDGVSGVPGHRGGYADYRGVRVLHSSLSGLRGRSPHPRGTPEDRTWQREQVSGIAGSLEGLGERIRDGAKEGSGLAQHVDWANEWISNEELGNLIRSILLEIGVMLITGQLVGAGIAALRGLNMARRIALAGELIAEARSARVVFTVGELVFQASAATVASAGLRGKAPTSAEFAENLIGNALAAAAMRPFQRFFATPDALKAEVSTWYRAVSRTGRFVARGAAEVGTGIAANKIAHAVVTGEGLSGPGGQEITVQALSFLAGRVVHNRAVALNARIEAAMTTVGRWYFADLARQSSAHLADSRRLGLTPTRETAVRLLERDRHLLLGEQEALKSAAVDGKPVDLKANAAELAAFGTDQIGLVLGLTGLEAVPGTTAYRGSEASLEDAKALAAATGVPLEVTGSGDTRTVRSGDQVLELHLREPGAGRRAAKPIRHFTAEQIIAVDPNLKVDASNVAALARQLRVPKVRIDPALTTGVEIHYRRVKARLGHDIEITELVVGRDARVRDALNHLPTIKRVSEYNGLLGKLRQFWRLVVGNDNPFPRGSRGWEAFEELTKLNLLIDDRAGWDRRRIDPEALDREIAFLEGRRAFYEDLLASMGDVKGDWAGTGIGKISMDDMTAVAEKAGYRRPKVNPGAYYFRRRAGGRPGEYELVVRPGAPAGTPSMRVRGPNSEPEVVGEREVVLLSTRTDPGEVVRRMWEDPSFDAFATHLILGGQGLARSRAEVNRVIREVYSRSRASNRGAVRWDTVRGNVKDVFRPLIEKRLARANYDTMREMLDPLWEGDRGNLAEYWYRVQQTTLPERSAHVPVTVQRPGGLAEKRVMDLHNQAKRVATELKDIDRRMSGELQDQFWAYVDMLRGKATLDRKPLDIDALEYVFTKPEGALANLGFFFQQVPRELAWRVRNPVERQRILDNLTVIVFIAGTPERITLRDLANKGLQPYYDSLVFEMDRLGRL